MPSICLAMIVKDEARVIERCLAAVKDRISSWCIVDTGSSDDTPARIEKCLEGIPGKLHHRPWVGFATNRTEALVYAREFGSDYILMVDADDTFVWPEGWQWPELDASAYELRLQSGNVSWWRAQIFRTADPWSYQYEIHELACGGGEIKQLQGPWIRIGDDGARRSKGETEAFLADAEILKKAVDADPSDARSWFYLGQSLWSAKIYEAAINAYARRVDLGGWFEERWYSQYQIGRLWEAVLDGWPPGSSFDVAIESYDAAYRMLPTRNEPLVLCASLLRRQGRHSEAFMRASTAIQIPRPDHRWLVDESFYTWRALDEFSLSAHNLGYHAQAADIVMRLLSNPKLPSDQRERLIANLGFFRKALGAQVAG